MDYLDNVEKCIDPFSRFSHGQTYQAHPVSCAAALQVQQIIQQEGLLENVTNMGRYLELCLKQRLGNHRYVGDIRGRGLFWGVGKINLYFSIYTLIVSSCLTSFTDRIC